MLVYVTHAKEEMGEHAKLVVNNESNAQILKT